MMEIIGIAGGSGAGKSTVSYELQDQQPGKIEVLNLDDYQMVAKPRPANLPMVDGMINWDHPDIIKWNDLLADMAALRNGDAVTIDVWAHRSNPGYHQHKTMKPRTIYPRPVLIVEGYLALHHPDLRNFYDTSFYLDIDEQTRNARRDKGNVVTNPRYETEVLIPMHEQFVEPTKAYADHVIDVSTMTVNAVCEQIRQLANLRG